MSYGWLGLLVVILICCGLIWREVSRQRTLAVARLHKLVSEEVIRQRVAEEAHMAAQVDRIQSMLPPNTRLTELKRFGDYDPDQRVAAVSQMVQRELHQQGLTVHTPNLDGVVSVILKESGRG
jgi:hypothetical protein